MTKGKKKKTIHTKINHEYKKKKTKQNKTNKQAQDKVMPKTTKINHNY